MLLKIINVLEKGVLLREQINKPMATAKSAFGGMVNQELRDYYRERALHSHIGLIITEHSYISNQGKAGEHQLSMTSDDVVESLKTLTDTIHKTDAKIVYKKGLHFLTALF